MPKARLALHSKIVLVASALLIVLGAGVLILIEKLPGERALSVGRSEIEARVRDRSDLAPEELSDIHYPPELVAGRFVHLMQDRLAAAEGDEPAQARERQALALGLALLEGKEVL